MGITNWNAMDWVAVIGAAAWAPQIFTWAYRFFTKPKITLYLHSSSEIGYTGFGPIFNANLALMSEKKDITLNNFSVNVKHENGASYTFDWDGLSESLSEMQAPSGLLTSVKKIYLPLVVRVVSSGVAQAFVRYQYKPFKQKFNEAVKDAFNEFQRLRDAGRINTEQDVDGLTANKEISKLASLIDSEFIWVAGKYTLTFDFKSPSKFNYTKKKYTFSLSQEDIRELRKNLDNIKLDITQTAKGMALKGYKAKEISWIWRFPELRGE